MAVGLSSTFEEVVKEINKKTNNKGTVTQVKINGTTKTPDNAGLVDLGTVGGSSPIMPIIELVSVTDHNGTMRCNRLNPLRFTIRVLEGDILPTDEIQICHRQLFTYKRGHRLYPSGEKVYDRAYKLRKICGWVAENCSVTDFYVFEMNGENDLQTLMRSGLPSGNISIMTKYIRISREYGGANGRLFSNLIPIYMSPSAPVGKINSKELDYVKIRIR